MIGCIKLGLTKKLKHGQVFSLPAIMVFFWFLISVAQAADLDNDTLPDDWETANGYDPAVPHYIVAAGWHTSCAKDDNGVSCWGAVSSGQNTNIPSFTNLKQLAVGASHVCGLDDNGVQCWGNATYTAVPAMTGVTQISSFKNHTCALHDSGVSCWGDNGNGQISAPSLTNPVDISAGGSHSCALDNTGVVCWGNNGNGQASVPALTNPTDVTAGDRNTCAIHNDGEVACWGLAGAGQSSPPAAIDDAIELSIGQNMSCAIRDSSDPYLDCWGSNGVGQSSPPEMANVRQISSGYQHYCSLADEGIRCWGRSAQGQISIDNFSFDIDGDASPNDEENLAGTENNDPDERPYWWRTYRSYDSLGYFGSAVSNAGDVNNDGYSDHVIGGYWYMVNSSRRGIARIFSGKDGQLIHQLEGNNQGDYFGYSVSDAGDVNGDGYADVIIGAPYDDNSGFESGTAQVFSGLDGSNLYVFAGDNADDYFGISVHGAGDVNNDGYDDIIVGAEQDDNNGDDSGMVRVLSGLNGAILYEFNGAAAGDNFGLSVSAAGDVNGDGYADVIVGSSVGGSSQDEGYVKVFSGIDGSELYFYNGFGLFGESVGGLGDVNNDGHSDFLVAAPSDDTGGLNRGMVVVYSGIDGSSLYALSGEDGEQLGFSVSGTGDLDNDTYNDLVVSGYGFVRILSGASGNLLFDIPVSGFPDVGGLANNVDGSLGFIASNRAYHISDLANDVDYDNVKNNADPDDDNDGMPDSWEELYGLNALLDDSSDDPDGDGMTNLYEYQNGFNPIVFDNDTDSDGVSDPFDNCPIDSNPAQIDSDGDGNGDACDSDDDNDGMPDDWELLYSLNPFANDAALDPDSDGMSNLYEYQHGFDPTVVDNDADGDGRSDPFDNCPSVFNPGQENNDGDSEGDVCDLDDDNDGMPDSWELIYGLNALLDDSSVDSDGDGMSNLYEYQYGFNPIVVDNDADGDGRSDPFDNCPSVFNPGQENNDGDSEGDVCDLDDDNDGMPDAWEALYGFDATIDDGFGDADLDGGTNLYEYTNALDPLIYDDLDVDGSTYFEEYLAGTNNNDAGERPYWWRTLAGKYSEDEFGCAVVGIGDINGDAVDDFAIGTSSMGGAAATTYGYVQLISGADGAVIREHQHVDPFHPFCNIDNAGDINGDGYNDIIVGWIEEWSVGDDEAWIYSGADGSVIYALSDAQIPGFGYSVSGLGDINNDGYADVAVGSTSRGIVSVYSGIDGNKLYEATGILQNDEFGSVLASAGDVNADGYPDILVGGGLIYLYDYRYVHILNGNDGSLIHELITDSVIEFGDVMEGLGDINGDGYEDFVINACDGNALNFCVYSGLDASTIYNVTADPGEDKFGQSIAVLDDLDNDGYNDFVVGSEQGMYRSTPIQSGAGKWGEATIYSGHSGKALYQFLADQKNDNFGIAVSGVGDIDQDGYSDLAIGATRFNNGRVRIIRSSGLFNDVDLDYLVNSFDSDDDGDNLEDTVEALIGTDPLSADSDNNGLDDDGEDSDGDSLPNIVEINKGLDPANAADNTLPLNDSYRGKSLQHQQY